MGVESYHFEELIENYKLTKDSTGYRIRWGRLEWTH